MNNTVELRKFVEEKPWTAVTGAALVGFAFGSGMALPILMGAGMSRAGLGTMVKSWLAKEVEQGLRDYMRPRQAKLTDASAQAGPVEEHGETDSGAPGETPLARQVRRELGY